MSANGASPSKISNPFSDCTGSSLRPRRRTTITAILIVEDDVLANEHLEFILQQAGYEVFSATSAHQAAELLDDHEDVQLLVTDIHLPGTVDGLKLAAAVKARRPEMEVAQNWEALTAPR